MHLDVFKTELDRLMFINVQMNMTPGINVGISFADDARTKNKIDLNNSLNYFGKWTH